jgi:hypothetical protein
MIIETDDECLIGFWLNQVIFVDNTRYEVVRTTTQMKNGKKVKEFELVPMPESFVKINEEIRDTISGVVSTGDLLM